MARKSKGKKGSSGSVSVTATVKVSGSIKPQMAKDVATWTRNQIAKECRRLFDMANKRINRLESSGVLSPALHAVMKEGKFYAKGKDLNQMRHEYARVVQFLGMDTSTVSGARKYENHLVSIMGGKKLSDEQRSTLFDAFRRLKEISPAMLMSYGSDRLISYLADEITSEDENIENGPDVDFERLVQKAVAEVTAAYEHVEKEFTDTFKDVFSF